MTIIEFFTRRGMQEDLKEGDKKGLYTL